MACCLMHCVTQIAINPWWWFGYYSTIWLYLLKKTPAFPPQIMKLTSVKTLDGRLMSSEYDTKDDLQPLVLQTAWRGSRRPRPGPTHCVRSSLYNTYSTQISQLYSMAFFTGFYDAILPLPPKRTCVTMWTDYQNQQNMSLSIFEEPF